MPIGHWYVIFGEMSIQVICPFFNWILRVFCLFLLEWALDRPCNSLDLFRVFFYYHFNVYGVSIPYFFIFFYFSITIDIQCYLYYFQGIFLLFFNINNFHLLSFFLVNLAGGLSILLIFSKNQLLGFLIFFY